MKKVIIYIIVTIVSMSLIFGIIDYFRIKDWEMPYFCIKIKSYDYNESGVKIMNYSGSGKYIGLGYSIQIYKENNAKNIMFRINEYSYKIFGVEIKHETRKI